MLNDDQARRSAGQTARARAFKHYGVEAWVNKLIRIYENADGRHDHRSAPGDTAALHPGTNRKDGVS